MITKYIYLIILLVYLSISQVSTVYARESGGAVIISTSIPAKFLLRIYGYTSPNSIVQAESVRIFAQSASDRHGYFLFDNIPISSEAKEICVSSLDSERRTSFPLCIALPSVDKETEIGPLILPPTLSFSGGGIWQNQKANATGKTVPDKEVIISFFEVPQNTLSTIITRKIAHFFLPSAQAANLPFLTIHSDPTGNFSFTLPTARDSAYRFFARTIYRENIPSPKSQTLSYIIGSMITYFLIYILPKILTVLIILLILYILIGWEYRYRKLRYLYYKISEKKLRPFGVRAHLKYQRLVYNLLEFLKPHRK